MGDDDSQEALWRDEPISGRSTMPGSSTSMEYILHLYWDTALPLIGWGSSNDS